MNDESTKRPHLSPSQIESYTRCPEAYRRRYIEGEKIPPAIAMLKGSGVHRGAETNFRQKLDSHEDLPAQDIVDAAIAGFEDQTAGGYSLSEEEASRGATIVVSEAKDATARMAKGHALLQAPDYQPLHIEEGVRILLPGATHDLLGYVDLIDDRRRVTDFKTAAKKKPQGDADTSVQLTYYAAAAHVLTGEAASEVRLDSVIDRKKGPADRQVLQSTRGPDDFQALANRASAVLAGIEAGIFPPASSGAWWCSDRFCGFARSCPYISLKNGERKR